tara:strand:+ start:872 stop:1183 length:312 start_codon:yes stop_codon:yes gene_type:complete
MAPFSWIWRILIIIGCSFLGRGQGTHSKERYEMQMIQTEDYRIGMLEGVLSCFLAEVIDADEFWYTMAYPICAESDNVIRRLNEEFEWLEPEQRQELIEACPS